MWEFSESLMKILSLWIFFRVLWKFVLTVYVSSKYFWNFWFQLLFEVLNITYKLRHSSRSTHLVFCLSFCKRNIRLNGYFFLYFDAYWYRIFLIYYVLITTVESAKLNMIGTILPVNERYVQRNWIYTFDIPHQFHEK
jgi:hypothetical protein